MGEHKQTSFGKQSEVFEGSNAVLSKSSRYGVAPQIGWLRIFLTQFAEGGCVGLRPADPFECGQPSPWRKVSEGIDQTNVRERTSPRNILERELFG